MTFRCKIELEGAASNSSAELQVDIDMRTAIEWLMQGAQRDFWTINAMPCVTFEHAPGTLVIRIDKNAATEVAVARRFS